MSKSVLVNGEFQHIIKALEAYGVGIAAVKRNKHLPKPVAAHADMNYFILGNQMFVAGGAEAENLHLDGYSVTELDLPGNRYPYDVICNAKPVGEHLFCSVRTIDKKITECAIADGYKIIDIRQGYAGCSICKVNDTAIITSDKGIADAAERNQIDVLFIDNSDIKLPGYDVGFIGGCTGLLNDSQLLFTGNLNKCSFGKAMRDFCENYGVAVIELIDDKPIDIGGIQALDHGRRVV